MHHYPSRLGRRRAKPSKPTKRCCRCGLPFEWRKKWARCWDEVKYCSKRCRNNSN
ncbi:DUF2256 domain-containing protein [Aliagarivorans marinus]|uniref:DUF2256 domain-containing protein n=1 Tax=Aliagarivorans marinus TaxID=561965 RepID=UPI0009FF51D3|nr:DUF2256 domain-containing protein [Aliagarivorans marinus]